jgi:hypothetical protein
MSRILFATSSKGFSEGESIAEEKATLEFQVASQAEVSQSESSEPLASKKEAASEGGPYKTGEVPGRG